MFRRILVPVDDSARGHQSMILATRLAKRFGAVVLLLRVKPPKVNEQDIAHGTRALEAWAEEVRREGVACDSMLDLDRTVEGIVATAEYQGSDLIVMAPHHRAWIEALRRPSVTEDMIALSPAPLLIWPDRMPTEAAASLLESPASMVIVPLDGSKQAEQALPYAAELATRYERGLLLVRVVPPVVLPGVGPHTMQFAVHLREEEQVSARTYLRRMRERMMARFAVTAQSMVLAGPPTTELLRLAEAHPESVLVMTTHGRGRVGRAFLGSVATQLAHHAAIPLFVLRAGIYPRLPRNRDSAKWQDTSVISKSHWKRLP